jgi:O-antigen/teichoic acid export membrane protein
MGIVFKQSFLNTLVIYFAFAIGGVNALFLYTYFLQDEYYGLVTFLLSMANILMPLTAFGVQYVIIKYFSSYQSEIEKDRFLSSALVLPLLIAIPFGFIGAYFYENISSWLSIKNPIVKEYTYIIYLIAILTAYFEIFYAWAKVQLQTVFGNLIKELFHRIAAMILLFLVYFGYINESDFVYYLTLGYFFRTLVMMLYAFYLRKPKFTYRLPENYKEVIRYAFYIILAGSAGSILLDIDKVMIPQKEAIALTAYYAVAVYIGSVIEAPGRAMANVVQPLTAKALNEGNVSEVASLYRKSSINLFLISGLVFLLVNTNINQLYELIKIQYAQGVWIVLMISSAKLYHMILGNNGAIISNSKYYRILLPYSLIMAISVYFLNNWLIVKIGINGAAISTLFVVFVFNSIKLYYVKLKFGLTPFTNKTGLLFLIILVFFGSFYFWDFPFNPILSIILKSILLSTLYLVVIIKLNIAPESIAIWKQFKTFLFKK